MDSVQLEANMVTFIASPLFTFPTSKKLLSSERLFFIIVRNILAVITNKVSCYDFSSLVRKEAFKLYSVLRLNKIFN